MSGVESAKRKNYDECEAGVTVANGNKGDDPILDITVYKIPRFSPKADALVAEIVHLGARDELECSFNLLAPPPIATFEAQLKVMRNRIFGDRKDRGWEV